MGNHGKLAGQRSQVKGPLLKSGGPFFYYHQEVQRLQQAIVRRAVRYNMLGEGLWTTSGGKLAFPLGALSYE
jgi:hypothetical protein